MNSVFDPAVAIGAAVTTLEGNLASTAPLALAVGAAVLGLGFAWKLVKKFSKG